MVEERKNPLRTVIRYSILTFLILFLVYLSLNVAIIALQFQQKNSSENVAFYDVAIKRAENLSQQIGVISDSAWGLLAPFIQLALLFFIIDWILTRFGIDVFSKDKKIDWNIQTIIALIVVSAFAIAALAGIDGVGNLKDVALVVVGFYFGSQRKNEDIQIDKKEIAPTEGHLPDEERK